MALVSVIGPGSPVVVEGFSLPGATVERVELRAGASPLVYTIAWRDSPTGPLRRAQWRGDRVTEPDPIPGTGGAPGSNKLADLGRQMTDHMGGRRE